jgi:hypothetical protein
MLNVSTINLALNIDGPDFIEDISITDDEKFPSREIQREQSRQRWRDKNPDYEKKRWAKGLTEEQVLARRAREKKRYWENKKDRETRKERARERKRALKDISKY